MIKAGKFRLHLRRLYLLPVSAAAVHWLIFSGAGSAVAAEVPNPGPAPFPVSTNFAGEGQKNVFSYALESGFMRISFANMAAGRAPAAAGKSGKAQAKTGEARQIYGLIAMELKPGWKTYWRNPGTSGFAPKIELDGGARAEILFPAPQLFRGPGEEWSYGYKTRVRLPFRLILPPQPQNFYSGTLTIGICETLCMPQKIPFRFSTSIVDNDRETAEIAAALATVPKAANKNFQLLSAKAVTGGLRLVLRYPPNRGEEAPHLFLDGFDMQTGQARPVAGPGKSRPGTLNRAKKPLQIYEAPLLLDEAEIGAPIAYTAVLKNGEAVSGQVHVEASGKGKP
ncbi:protein-disulfide reductase DsbD domain-containing protein [Candidatus Tokpelaia sp.]|uniref:protein-disulfide reductase DsbD domain-containing protein n=1 Tax=Candidatus Tokpelaia sp. TaxID=2233777 RepID=UPI00123B9393|nr:protein-disulfide reductase DsbD domain-containing protein [Candidatus Tokpelaia sp.]KAA6405285.1 hypothetical protein DPQ22_05340 [Candidatus Tokpelaia sp.]